jgi:hypothetical protein
LAGTGAKRQNVQLGSVAAEQAAEQKAAAGARGKDVPV